MLSLLILYFRVTFRTWTTEFLSILRGMLGTALGPLEMLFHDQKRSRIKFYLEKPWSVDKDWAKFWIEELATFQFMCRFKMNLAQLTEGRSGMTKNTIYSKKFNIVSAFWVMNHLPLRLINIKSFFFLFYFFKTSKQGFIKPHCKNYL